MFWALDLDDFKGSQCGEGPYPLMTAVTRALAGGVLPPRPTRPPRPSTMRPRPSSRPPRPSTMPPSPSTRPPNPGSCHSIPPFQNESNDRWCVANCAVGYCPASHCKCDWACMIILRRNKSIWNHHKLCVLLTSTIETFSSHQSVIRMKCFSFL